jgi:hypothetical protein
MTGGMAAEALIAYDPAEDLLSELADEPADADVSVHLTPSMLGRWIEDAGRISGVVSTAPPPAPAVENPDRTMLLPANDVCPAPTSVRIVAPARPRVPLWLVSAFVFMFAIGSALIAFTLLG